ncbi:MAG: metallophosphoesterase family protein [Planctomycetota bacterium]|nr:metallophosphoesterase family protein [Planctomycetota bacterium]
MPRIGLISDVHANLDALAAVLADVRTQSVDALASLGDVVGYGPDPGECLDLIAQSCDVMIRGNHDEAVLRADLQPHFRLRAWRSIEASRQMLTPGHEMLIESMRSSAEVAGVALAHASFGPRRFEYLYDPGDAAAAFRHMPRAVGAVGHTHVPALFILDEPGSAPRAVALEADRPATIPEGAAAVVNPGSVGQPRDRNPDASWAILDTDARTFTVRRVSYDVRRVQERMQTLGMPDYHSLRLSAGV